MSTSKQRQQKLYAVMRIGPSPASIALGLAAYLIGTALGIRFLTMVAILLQEKTLVGASFTLGGTVVIGFFTFGLFSWGTTRLRSTTVKEAILNLHAEDADLRRSAASALMRAKWIPATEGEQIDLLIAAEEWQKAVELGDIGVMRVLDSLRGGESSLPTKLMALRRSKSQLAVKPLIDILAHVTNAEFRGMVVETLRQLTGKDFGENQKEWLDWYEQIHSPAKTSEQNSLDPQQTKNSKKPDIPIVVKETADKHFGHTYEYWNESKYEEALEECNKVIKLTPEWSEAHNLRGVILDDMGRTDEAILAYREAIRLDPQATEACESLASAMREKSIKSRNRQRSRKY